MKSPMEKTTTRIECAKDAVVLLVLMHPVNTFEDHETMSILLVSTEAFPMGVWICTPADANLAQRQSDCFVQTPQRGVTRWGLC